MYNCLLNMFTSIQNGQIAGRGFILQSRKKICEAFLKILWAESFIFGYKIYKKNPKQFQIFLKYKKNNNSVINNIKSITKPGRRVFYSVNNIWKITNSNSIIIIVTPKGVKSITECKQYKIGGEPFILLN